MIRKVNLIEYLPQIVQDYREIKEVMTTENPEFQLVEDESEILMNNQFVETANERGIKRFEDMLGIKALDDDTLENRKFKVLSVWNNAIPYSIRALKQKLAVLCGEDGYSLNIEYSNYKITVRVSLISKKNFSQVEKMLNEVVPCNMIIDVNLLYNQHETLAKFTHKQLSSYTHEQLRNEVLS
nr:putative phage tail protein [uncultured Anaerocolumna sp.]